MFVTSLNDDQSTLDVWSHAFYTSLSEQKRIGLINSTILMYVTCDQAFAPKYLDFLGFLLKTNVDVRSRPRNGYDSPLILVQKHANKYPELVSLINAYDKSFQKRNDMQTINLFNSLPKELVEQIFYHLTPRQLAFAASVNKRFNMIAQQNKFKLITIQKAFLNKRSKPRKYKILHPILNCQKDVLVTKENLSGEMAQVAFLNRRLTSYIAISRLEAKMMTSSYLARFYLKDIIFILECVINLKQEANNDPSPLKMAKFYKSDFPELFALLSAYHNFYNRNIKTVERLSSEKVNLFESLPVEMTTYILHLLSPDQLSRMAQTCKYFYNIAMHNEFDLTRLQEAFSGKVFWDKHQRKFSYFSTSIKDDDSDCDSDDYDSTNDNYYSNFDEITRLRYISASMTDYFEDNRHPLHLKHLLDLLKIGKSDLEKIPDEKFDSPLALAKKHKDHFPEIFLLINAYNQYYQRMLIHYFNLFIILPNEIIEAIFNYLTPNQLALAAKTCHRFNAIAKQSHYPLSKIQQAFFNKVPTIHPSEGRHVLDYRTRKDLTKCIINKEEHGLNELYFALFTYIAYKNANHDATIFLMKIIFLLEKGVNVNLKPKLYGPATPKSALEVATELAKKYPELLTLVDAYHEFNAKNNIHSPCRRT